MGIIRTLARQLLPAGAKRALRAQLFRLSSYSGIDQGSVLQIKSFGCFELAYRRGTADESVLGEAFGDLAFFSNMPEYQPAETDVIIDVGAHIGTFAVQAASRVPRGRVYAVEACKDTFNFLRVNAALNHATNLLPFHVALSDREGTCKLHYDNGNWGHSVVSRLSRRGEVVPCCTLQRFLEENDIRECAFMKLNCEGAEFPILLAAPAEVLRRIRMMLVDFHGDLWSKNSEQDLVSHLESAGFRCTVRNRKEKRGWIIAASDAASMS